MAFIFRNSRDDRKFFAVDEGSEPHVPAPTCESCDWRAISRAMGGSPPMGEFRRQAGSTGDQAQSKLPHRPPTNQNYRMRSYAPPSSEYGVVHLRIIITSHPSQEQWEAAPRFPKLLGEEPFQIGFECVDRTGQLQSPPLRIGLLPRR
jgi:hypothetical protein